MPKIIKTIINNNPGGVKPWFDTTEYNSYFTQDQIDNIITPYTTFVQNLTGFISINVENIQDGLVIKHEFDTRENMQTAIDALGGPKINNIVKSRNDLFTKKLQKLGANYRFTITFE